MFYALPEIRRYVSGFMDEVDPGEQTKLNLWLSKRLSYPALMVLRYKQEDLTQKQIADRMRTSEANVSKIVRRLRNLGLIVGDKIAELNPPHVGGENQPPLDVRYRVLKWNLTKPIKLPGAEHELRNGVKVRIWSFKGCSVRTNIGKDKHSLEIEAGAQEGYTQLEVERKHDEKALVTYDWLVEHYPELKEISSRLNYTNEKRRGELNLRQLSGLAEKYLEDYGNLKTEVLKIDKTPPPAAVQLLLDGIASKSDFSRLEGKFDKLLDTLNTFIERLSGGGVGEIPKAPKDKEAPRPPEGWYRRIIKKLVYRKRFTF